MGMGGRRRWDAERALRLIEAERVTAFTGVPTMMYELLNSPHFAKTVREPPCNRQALAKMCIRHRCHFPLLLLQRRRFPTPAPRHPSCSITAASPPRNRRV